MMPTPNRTRPWLHIGAVTLFLVAAVILFLGVVAASGATADREDIESSVDAQRSTVETAQVALARAETTLEAARVEAADARAGLDAARVTLDDAHSTRGDAEELLSEIRARTPRFVSSVSTTIDEVEAAMPGLLEVVERQAGLLDAILEGDHRGFNDLYAAYLDPATALAQEMDDLAARFDLIPDVPISRPAGYSGAAVRGRAPDESLDLDPPTGRAVITVELPDEIACSPWGDGGCKYSWTAVFTESNWLGVTIDRIGIRYRRGSMYCTIGYPGESTYEREWDDVFLSVPPNGTDRFSGSLAIDPSDECWPIRGGELLLRWEGTDAEGRNLSGRATAPLEKPS